MFHKQNPPVGSRPGTLAIPPDSPRPVIHLFQYNQDELVERRIDAIEELAVVARSQQPTWVDVKGLGDEAVLRRLAELFEIDPLALEDAVNAPQRAKSEARERHQVIITRLPLLTEAAELETPQICLLLGPHHLLTFQERALGVFDPVRDRLRAWPRADPVVGPGLSGVRPDRHGH